MTPLVAEVLRMVSERGGAGEFVGVLVCLPALVEAGEAGFIDTKRNDWGAIESIVLTASGTKALAQANLWLRVAARAGYEAASAVIEEKTNHGAIQAWAELGAGDRQAAIDVARAILAGRPAEPFGFAKSYGDLEGIFRRVVIAAFGEGE